VLPFSKLIKLSILLAKRNASISRRPTATICLLFIHFIGMTIYTFISCFISAAVGGSTEIKEGKRLKLKNMSNG
jgi:hypothetical protein